ncbi:hypothetical protein [Clostridium tagluense]|uniref:hypothetical protein n=1 Tax=Clostridium tagluense TaxID=360422 RepID=UPI001C6F32DE|nr:hypothetical protein [Clostridium tagluense]MBW9157110.1 hypothetical protein [Clostridium tagluense]WLC67281.1 hypothetical protein KTC93_08925 [Clostridium tagluense]
MTWAKSAGKLVTESEWKDSTTNKESATPTANTTTKTGNTIKTPQFGGRSSEALYDFKAADTTK